MKKFQSILATLLVAVLMTASFSSCSSDGDKVAKEFVEEANTMLPQKQGALTAEKARIEDKNIVFEFTIAPSAGISLDAFKGNESAMKEAALNQVKQNSNKEEMDRIKALAEAGYSIKYVYTSGDESFDLVITPEELLDAMK